jgi:hypothetical protein
MSGNFRTTAPDRRRHTLTAKNPMDMSHGRTVRDPTTGAVLSAPVFRTTQCPTKAPEPRPAFEWTRDASLHSRPLNELRPRIGQPPAMQPRPTSRFTSLPGQ